MSCVIRTFEDYKKHPSYNKLLINILFIHI